MYNYILKKFGLTDVSPKVLRATNIIVVLLSLAMSALTMGGLLESDGPNTLAAIAIGLVAFPLFLFCFGLYAYVILAGFYGVTRILAKVPDMLRGLRDGFVSLWRGFVAVLQWCAGVPMALAAVSRKDWYLVIYMVSSFAVFGLIGYNLWPFATAVVHSLPSWLPGPRDYHAVAMADLFMTAFAFMAVIVLVAIVWAVEEYLRRQFKR